jgi:hypothetical protein
MEIVSLCGLLKKLSQNVSVTLILAVMIICLVVAETRCTDFLEQNKSIEQGDVPEP